MVRTKKASSETEKSDKNKTVQDWGKLAKEILVLKCNNYALEETGTKLDLQKRLVEHCTKNNDTSNNTNEHEQQMPQETTPSIREELAELRAMIVSMNEHNMSRGRTVTFQDIPQNIQHNQPPPQSQPSLEIIEHRDRTVANLTQYENQFNTNTTNRQQAQHGFQGTNPAASPPGNNTIYLDPSILNPYTPPALEAKTLAKVVKLEYVDFDILLPSPIQTTSEQSFEIEVTPDDNINITRNNKKSANKILDFPSWMCAWNLFTQATLHKHPQLQFVLFSYQKEFCHLVRRFKFEACYSYDKAQRKNIASQNSMPALSRTVSWDKRNEELYNIFLRQF